MDIAESLAERGHVVKVLTGFPNYPSGVLQQGYRQRWRRRDQLGPVQVLRVPMFIDHSQSALKRVVNYTSFALSALTARRFAKGSDVVYVYATPMTAGVPAWIWRLLFGVPYVLHVQDLWPDSVLGSTMVGEGRGASLIGRALTPWLRSMYRQAAAVIGIAPTMVSTLVDRGSPAASTMLIYNWAGDASGSEAPRVRVRRGAAVRVVYAGNVGAMQDLGTAIRAVHAAKDTGVHLEIVGDGVAHEELQTLVSDLGVENVSFHGPVPRERMPEVYARSDVALVPLKDLPVFRGTIPSKLQAVLAAGLPVLTTVQGDVRAFVEAHGLGFTADPEDVEALESSLRAVAASSAEERCRMGANAARAYRDNFTRESGIDRIESVLVEAARGKSRRR
ncbi:glycosyltransferase family 4 protein [Microbacterium capsulatum]|uniref:D-inositol 3-phosphate glycosyltransferase n=1 Tax=Microbacterium capsulatum TaxID=3041921 RepID=A0ABU0XGI2_9MICO|nr:glycosyltransferase family 4 protein [Microbacterium sp. ASV81]MDQ4214241.1 glycosyltransferase family 4 protein [Microbacterium sp. ASV81]